MAPKHYHMPLSGGDRKALKKELSKSRAMTHIFAERSAEKRRESLAPGRQPDRQQMNFTDSGDQHRAMRKISRGLLTYAAIGATISFRNYKQREAARATLAKLEPHAAPDQSSTPLLKWG